LNALSRNILKTIAFFGAGAGILYLVYLNFNESYQEQCRLDGIPPEQCNLLQKVITDFAEANYFWIALVFVAFILSNLSRTLKWQMLLEPLGYKVNTTNAFLAIMLGYFANLGLPRLGEVVRCGALAKYERIPMEKVMGSVFMDRVTDVAIMILIVGLTLIMQYGLLSDFLKENAEFALSARGIIILLLIMSVLILLVYFIFKALKKYNPVFADRLIAMGKGFIEGLRGIRKLKRPYWFVFHSFFIWIMYFLMTYLAFFAYEPTAHLGIAAALMVYTLGALGMLIPTPGGMGSFHYLAVVGLALYGILPADGFSFANIVFFSVQLGCSVTLGLLALILLPVLNKNKLKENPTGNEIVESKNAS
jgi:glycosyltransferase 2 family protein